MMKINNVVKKVGPIKFTIIHKDGSEKEIKNLVPTREDLDPYIDVVTIDDIFRYFGIHSEDITLKIEISGDTFKIKEINKKYIIFKNDTKVKEYNTLGELYNGGLRL